MAEYPLLGIGYRNWLTYYRRHYNPTGELVHNIFLEAGAEMGYSGLAAFIAGILATFLMNWRTRRAIRRREGFPARLQYYLAHGLDGALVGYMVAGFFVTVLYYPFFWINLAMTVVLRRVSMITEERGRRPRTRRVTPRARQPARPIGTPVGPRA